MSTQTITPRTAQTLGPCVPCLDRKKIEVPGVKLVGGDSWCDECFRGTGDENNLARVPPKRPKRKSRTSPIYMAIQKIKSGHARVIITTKNQKYDRGAVHTEAKKRGVKVTTTAKDRTRLLIERAS